MRCLTRIWKRVFPPKKKSEITEEEYIKLFGVGDKPDKQKAALELALDIRKFEIDLYWKRATYFWTFIAAAFTAYGVIQASSILDPGKTDLSVYISCLGLVFSCAWYCVNRGSKKWQENWEKHVDFLENEIIGPLYKINFSRSKPRLKRHYVDYVFFGPASFSSSKINLMISFYVMILWALLLFRLLFPVFDFDSKVNPEYSVITGFSIFICFLFFTKCKTGGGSHHFLASKRQSSMCKSI